MMNHVDNAQRDLKVDLLVNLKKQKGSSKNGHKLLQT